MPQAAGERDFGGHNHRCIRAPLTASDVPIGVLTILLRVELRSVDLCDFDFIGATLARAVRSGCPVWGATGRAVWCWDGAVRDPHEGVDSAGMIATGVGLDRVPVSFRPVIDAAIEAVAKTGGERSLYLYGSVATGTARTPASDVDLLTFGLEAERAETVAHRLSRQFVALCRSVDLAVAQPADLVGGGDAVYGNRVFLRHYCIHLCGPQLHAGLPAFPADRRAARGLNGDIAFHAQRWRSELHDGADAAAVGRRLARKTLLATAGLVSVHDRTWTTDRLSAARRWGEIELGWARPLSELVAWSDSAHKPKASAVENALDGIVTHLTDTFADTIGLWDKC